MICGIARPLHAREITLGISESCIENQNTINHILLSLKCYIHIYNQYFNIQNVPTGISDCHNIISVTIKGDVPVQKRKIITFRSYKNFDTDSFNCDLEKIYQISLLSKFFPSFCVAMFCILGIKHMCSVYGSS
jgi:hypothetical protein